MDWTENKLLKINDGLPFVEQYIIYCTILLNLRPTVLWHHLGQWPISFDSFNINIKQAKCSICCSCLCFMPITFTYYHFHLHIQSLKYNNDHIPHIRIQ